MGDPSWLGLPGTPDNNLRDDDHAPGQAYGSSTGWLQTQWPIDSGEQFDLVFHIHDTSDHVWDAQVILDNFAFVGEVDPGTVEIE